MSLILNLVFVFILDYELPKDTLKALSKYL